MTRPTWDQTFMNVAHVISERSLCGRDQVGAVIVSAGTPRIAATGYNGPPRKMVLAVDSLAVALSDVGCSSWCSRSANAAACGGGLHPEYHDCPAIHAEANALLYADASAIRGGTIYITSGICYNCAKLVANSGITRVVCDTTHAAPHRNTERTAEFLRGCGLTYDAMSH